MINDTSKTPYLKGKWLQDLVETIVHQHHVKKEMDILYSEIPKESKEIEYLRERTATSRKRLNETENAIKDVQLRLAGPKKKFIGIQKERQWALEEHDRLKEKEKDIESRLSDFPKMQVEIRELEADVRESSHRLASLKANHHEILQRKEKLGEECEPFKTKLMKLEEEITVMRNTRDILRGKRPDHFDAETFEIIQDDVEKTVENYVNEVNGEIERIKNEISSINAQLDEKQREEETLLSKKTSLPEIIERLKTDIGEEKDRETLMVELERSESEKNRLSVESEELKQEINRTEYAIKSIDNRLVGEGKIDSDLKERHSYLISRKQEMDNFENVADEIQRLRDEIQMLITDSEVDRALGKTIDNLKGGVDATRRQLPSSLEEYNRVFDEFQREIESLLSESTTM